MLRPPYRLSPTIARAKPFRPFQDCTVSTVTCTTRLTRCNCGCTAVSGSVTPLHDVGTFTIMRWNKAVKECFVLMRPGQESAGHPMQQRAKKWEEGLSSVSNARLKRHQSFLPHFCILYPLLIFPKPSFHTLQSSPKFTG